MILPGPGKVVLTTFHHASSHLIDLYLSPQPPTGVNSQANNYLTSTSNSATHPLTTFQTSEEALLYPQASRSSSIDPSWERIGVTGNHPIWSEDRHDYIAAMDLRVGERLKNLSGDTVYVQQKLPRPGPTPVYNLEVQDEHVYYVGTNGLLVHNSQNYNTHLNGKTPLPGTRGTGVQRAARAEVDMVRETGQGSVDWTPEEIAFIRENGRLPQGMVGHHINNVADFPDWAGDPRNIRFVRGQPGNLLEHSGNFQNKTVGPLIDREALRRKFNRRKSRG